MNSVKTIIFTSLIIVFLFISFYPTLFELSKSKSLGDPNREFILEHNFYWPDYNLYLSKIRQGAEGRLTALERYTSEPHAGSLIQEFYVVLGLTGKTLDLSPNSSYQLGRIILSPLLLIMIYFLINVYFKKLSWQILAFLIILSSGSFPRLITENDGALQVGRFMEWWSNIDAVQRITFIPHILFGQVVSLYLLYQITINRQQITGKRLFFYLILGNLAGIVFPPSLMTLIGVIILMVLVELKIHGSKIIKNKIVICYLLFVIFTLPSLLYLFFITRAPPWSSLVIFHRTHPMLIPFWEYLLGTGPVFFLALLGILISLIKKDRKYHPLTFWIMTTFLFAILFTHIKEQSPLRFTQTGLFIPLGILAAYFFYQLFQLSNLSNLSNLEKSQLKAVFIVIITLYISGSLFMMKISLAWQTNFITQRVRANIPAVPYPPQTMYPLKTWMDGIRFLKNNTARSDVVLAEITAGNFIPAYSGNTVFFGQSNTVNYEEKQRLVDKFFEGKMPIREAKIFLENNHISYIFYGPQEKGLPAQAGKSEGQSLEMIYTFLKPVYNNPQVIIYRF